MALLPLKIPPGVRRAGTEYLSTGRWYDSNLIRWYEGAMLPVGGWVSMTTVTGVPNCIVSWRANDGVIWVAIGTNSKIYAYGGGVLTDITPASGYTAGSGSSSGGSPYGSGLYGEGAYSDGGSSGSGGGTTTPGLLTDLSSVWQLDTFGELLIGVMSGDGQLWYWDLNTANNMALADSTTPAPIDNLGVVTTPERFVVLIGAGGDPRAVQWADQEVLLDWSGTTQAGDFVLETQGLLVAGLRMPRETMLFTDIDVWSMIYIGGTLIYSFERRGSNCGLISPHGKTQVGDTAFWMSDNGFYRYDGTVVQLNCEVYDYIFSNLNRSQKRKIFAVTNSRFGEVTWFYPSSTADANDRYVTYNYREGHWTIGQLARSAGIDRGAWAYPIMAGEDGTVYEHERGTARTGGGEVYARSGPVEVGQGDQTYMVRRVVPDEDTQGEVSLTFYTRLPGPLGTEYSHGPYTISSPTSVRFTGRQVAVKITEASSNSDFRVGTMRLDGVLAGER